VGFIHQPISPVRVVRLPSKSAQAEITQQNFVCSHAQFSLLFSSSFRTCTACDITSQFTRVLSITEHRHVIEVTFACELGRHRRVWSSSEKHADGQSYRLNDDFALSWLSCGGEGQMYQSFFEAVSCGNVSRDGWDETTASALPLIDAIAQLFVYVPNIATANEEAKRLQCGCKIGSDCQHNRSQRKSCKKFKSAAPFATTTVMNHTSADTSGDILAQFIIDKESLVMFGRGENQSKDKLGSDLASKFVAEVLDRIDLCISDQSGSCQKSYLDQIVSNSKHAKAKVGFEPWHMEKSMRKDLETLINTRRPKTEAEKKEIKDGKRTVLVYPEFGQLKITADSLLRWLRTLRKDFSDVDDCFAEEVEHYWLSSHDWVVERAQSRGVPLSAKFEDAYQSMLEDLLPSVLASRFAVFTSEEESLHNLCRVYWRKGVSYGLANYRARRNLVALDWQENHRKSKNSYQFRQILLQRFQQDRGLATIRAAVSATSMVVSPSWFVPLMPPPVMSWHSRRRNQTCTSC
jgi:hypothetical protein